MSMYVTPSDLASFLQKDLDTSTATLVLTRLSGLFDGKAHTTFGGTLSASYKKPGNGAPEIVLPFAPLVAISQVQVAGVTLTVNVDYTVIEQSLFRRSGWGLPWRFPPDLVQVDYTYGYSTVPDDVVTAVLESAAAAYESPDLSTLSEQIDDYAKKTSAIVGGLHLTDSASSVAESYLGVVAA